MVCDLTLGLGKVVHDYLEEGQVVSARPRAVAGVS
jgi:hypothetical protein